VDWIGSYVDDDDDAGHLNPHRDFLEFDDEPQDPELFQVPDALKPYCNTV
jgi:hypothetical protein